ncbi:hypothetical protein JCM10213_004520 [Rhodosporidiobolus nylandii]
MSFAKGASLEPIQSLSVSSHARVDKPEPHTLFTIAVSLPTRTYHVQQRYSAFEALHQTLTAQCGAAPPRPLPPKHPFSRLNLFASRTLTDEQLADRQAGLDAWLRSILADRDPRWRSSRVFKEFLAASPDAPVEGGGGAGEGKTGRDWTASSWMAERGVAEDAARELRALLDKRDSLLLDNSAAAHGVAKEVKVHLVDLVRRLADLTKGLDMLAKEGMTEGELSRRSAMVQRLQGDAEELGKKAGNAPRVGAGRMGGTGFGGGGSAGAYDEPPSSSRAALLGGHAARAPARVLGAPAKGASLETAETRSLDNGGIMQLQQQYMDAQDTQLESLTAALRRQRHLGEMINQELALQEDVLNQLETGTDRVQGKIKDAQKQMKRLWCAPLPVSLLYTAFLPSSPSVYPPPPCSQCFVSPC